MSQRRHNLGEFSMSLLVDRHLVEKYWGKTCRLGGDRDWKGTFFEGDRFYHVQGYKSVVEVKKRGDPYFETWLQDYYQDLQTTIEEKHQTWRYGCPLESSAFKSVVKYVLPIQPPNMEIFRHCQEWLLKEFAFMGNSKISFAFEYVESYLNMSTSPGFPFTRAQGQIPCFPNKRKLFAHDNGKYIQYEFKRYLEYISTLEATPITFHTLAAKFEMRKVKKITSNDFRTYISANCLNTMAGVGCFGEMNLKLYESWATSPSFIGGSTFHGAWDTMYRRLNQLPNAFACDVSNWDATLHEHLILALRDAMWRFVDYDDRTPQNHIIWDNLFREIVNSLVICPNGDLIVKWQGNPSGCSLTIVLNTLVHWMLYAYAWIKLCPDYEMQFSYIEFSKNVKLALCGDDSLGTCSDEVKPWFNVHTVATCWREDLSINTKPEAQAEGKLIDLQFLSQNQKRVGHMVVPYPDYDKSISSLLYHSNAKHHIRWSYLKACALRLSTYWNVETRKVLANYISWLERTHMVELTTPRDGSNPMDLFTWEEVKSVYKTDREIILLYVTNEGNAIKSNAPLKRFSDKFAKAIGRRTFSVDRLIDYATQEEEYEEACHLEGQGEEEDQEDHQERQAVQGRQADGKINANPAV